MHLIHFFLEIHYHQLIFLLVVILHIHILDYFLKHVITEPVVASSATTTTFDCIILNFK
jgi:hypothetical protein